MWMSRIQVCKVLSAFATKKHVLWRLFEEIYTEQSAEPAGTTCFLHLHMPCLAQRLAHRGSSVRFC